MRVALDLHIHTLLSPCAGIEMIPINIVMKVQELGIDMIAITDHNAIGNVSSVINCAKIYAPELKVLPGMEITSREEVHILGIFPNLESAKELESIIHSHLNSIPDRDYTTEQLIVDEDANFIKYEEHFLLGATDFSVEEISDLIHSFNGLVIPAHIDRESFGLIYTLGFFPPNLKVDAIELSKFATEEDLETIKPSIPFRVPIIFSSDAHFLSDISKPRTFLDLEEKSFEALKKALRNYKI
ncbi:MAG: PHP domain-containing protein [bacterium]|nr:PHP domain-containing protein [bacterium]